MQPEKLPLYLLLIFGWNPQSLQGQEVNYQETVYQMCNQYWENFRNKQSDLKVAFARWKPAGVKLVRLLREAAADLDSNQKTTDSTELLGGFATLVGGAMTLFPPTMPLGTALTVGGIGAGLGASGINYVKSSNIKDYVNNMINNYKFGYTELQEATNEFQEILPDMVRCLEDDEYLKYTEESDGHEEVPFRDFSDINEGESKESELGKYVKDAGGVQGVINGAKTATMAANAQRLAKVAPYIKYAGYSNRAMKAKMIKEAINAANLAKVAGTTGAAGRAARLAEISKVTQSLKVAKEGVKVGAWGITLAAAGLAFSIVDIAVNVNELSNGSVTADSKNYREIADDLETVMKSVEKLLAIGVSHL